MEETITPEQELIERYKEIILKDDYPKEYYKSKEMWLKENLSKIKELEVLLSRQIREELYYKPGERYDFELCSDYGLKD